MKKILTIVSAMMLLVSCSTWNKMTSKNSKSAEDTSSLEQQVVKSSDGVLVKPGRNDKVSTMPIKQLVIKLDTLNFMKINGLWTLRSIGEKTLSVARGDSEENRPYINFDSRQLKFYANDGCNTINGDFRVQGDSLTINPLLSTLMMCPDAPYQEAFKTGLARTVTFNKEEIGDENILSLFDEKGKVIMTLSRPTNEFLNGAWQVTKIDGKKIDNPGVKMVIDIPEEHVHGNTGCNTFNGTIFTDPDKAGSIQFQQVGVTRMLCPDMATETAFLVALESVEYARSNNGDALLLDGNHNEVLYLTPLQLKD